MNPWTRLWASCTDFGFYRAAADHTFGAALRTLLLAVLVGTAVLSAQLCALIDSASREYTVWLGPYFEGFSVRDGLVRWNTRLPQRFDLGPLGLFVDTRPEAAKTPFVLPSGLISAVRITQNALTVASRTELGSEIRTLSFQSVRRFELTKKSLESLRVRAIAVFFLFYLLLKTFSTYLLKILLALLFGLLVYLILHPAHIQPLTRTQRWNIALYAQIPVVLLQSAGAVVFPDGTLLNLVGAGMLCAFLVGGYWNFRNPAPCPPPTED